MAAKRDLKLFTMTVELVPSGEEPQLPPRQKKPLERERKFQALWQAARTIAAQVSAFSTSFLRPSARLPSPVLQCSSSEAPRAAMSATAGVYALSALCGVFALLAKIEVVARVVGPSIRSQGTVADGEVAQSRRHHHSLLRSADKNIDAPYIHVEMRGAETVMHRR